MNHRTQTVFYRAAVRILGLGLTLGAPTTALAQAAETVQILSVNGSGCPNGQASVTSVAPDLSSFAVEFDGYSASRLRRNCMFTISVPAPRGYTYAVSRVPASGEYSLKSNAIGYFGAYYYFMGMGETVSMQEPITDDGSNAWFAEGAFDGDELAYAPCDATRYLILNTSLRVSGDSSGASSVSIDPSFAVHLTWKRCE